MLRPSDVPRTLFCHSYCSGREDLLEDYTLSLSSYPSTLCLTIRYLITFITHEILQSPSRRLGLKLRVTLLTIQWLCLPLPRFNWSPSVHPYLACSTPSISKDPPPLSAYTFPLTVVLLKFLYFFSHPVLLTHSTPFLSHRVPPSGYRFLSPCSVEYSGHHSVSFLGPDIGLLIPLF